jgi:(+)-pinoresinol hydroxylase
MSRPNAKRGTTRAATSGSISTGWALLGFALAGTQGGSASAAEAPDAHAAGRAVYTKWCAPCHDPGVMHPGTNALTVKYKGVKSGVLLQWTHLQPATVSYTVRHGISVMPQFRKTEISDADLDILAKFLSRNSPLHSPVH